MPKRDRDLIFSSEMVAETYRILYSRAQKATLQRILDHAGVSRSAIYRWTLGASPNLIELEAILAACGCRLIIVLDDEEEEGDKNYG